MLWPVSALRDPPFERNFFLVGEHLGLAGGRHDLIRIGAVDACEQCGLLEVPWHNGNKPGVECTRRELKAGETQATLSIVWPMTERAFLGKDGLNIALKFNR